MRRWSYVSFKFPTCSWEPTRCGEVGVEKEVQTERCVTSSVAAPRKDWPYLVFDLPPGQLANHEFHEHVEEGPQVVVATHFLQMGGTRREARGVRGEAGGWTGGVAPFFSRLAHLVLVGVDGSVAHGASEAGHGTRLTGRRYMNVQDKKIMASWTTAVFGL